jgi:hypothetical protein
MSSGKQSAPTVQWGKPGSANYWQHAKHDHLLRFTPPQPQTTNHKPEKPENMKTPTIKKLSAALSRAKSEIDDGMIAMDDSEPSIDVTLACDDTGYALQLGDNSYSGPAYGFRHWGVANLYRKSNCRELARELINQCRELASH